MAKSIENDKVEIRIAWEPQAGKYIAQLRTRVVDGDLGKSCSCDMDLSGGTLQADVDALAAEALAQVKSDEGIV